MCVRNKRSRSNEYKNGCYEKDVIDLSLNEEQGVLMLVNIVYNDIGIVSYVGSWRIHNVSTGSVDGPSDVDVKEENSVGIYKREIENSEDILILKTG